MPSTSVRHNWHSLGVSECPGRQCGGTVNGHTRRRQTREFRPQAFVAPEEIKYSSRVRHSTTGKKMRPWMYVGIHIEEKIRVDAVATAPAKPVSLTKHSVLHESKLVRNHLL